LSNVSRFRRYWWEEANQHIRTMRAVWPARPAMNQPSDLASQPERQAAHRRIDAIAQSQETPTTIEEMMVGARK
jgi:hypothetical protein